MTVHLKLSCAQESPGDLAKTADFDSVSLRVCTSNKLAGDADATGPL